MGLGDTIVLCVIVGLVFAGLAWAFLQWREHHAMRRVAAKPFDPLEDDLSAWRAPGDVLRSPAAAATGVQEKRMDEGSRAPAYYVERVIPGGGATLGWILLVMNNMVCLFAMTGVQTIWAQILSGVIQLNGNVVILLLMQLGRRRVFVPGHGAPPADAR